MVYHITRGGQSYGPYTLADLQRYVASGHVQPSDLAKSDEMAEWVPVSQILNPSSLPPAVPSMATEYATPQPGFTASGYAQPAYAPMGNVSVDTYPNPPNLHWGLVLLFAVLTCGVFSIVWELVQAAWLKKVAPLSKALMLYIVADVAYLAIFSTSFMAGYRHHTGPGIAGLFQLAYVILNIWARFTFKASLEEHFNSAEPIGLQLSGVMTFFFGALYFQWHLSRINEIKQGLRYGGLSR